MKTKRILITLSLGYGINMMGFESSLTREQISVSNPELTVLSLREFCMLSKENLLRMDDMTPDKVAAIERLLAEYSLRLGMSDVELEAYLNRYYEENPKEKEFYDMCDRLCNSKPVFDENRFREELFRELNSSPMSEKRLSDLGWLRYQTVRETYLNQPFFLRWFGSQEARIKRAIKDTTIIHDMFCRLVTENCIESERWYFNHKEPEYIKEVRNDETAVYLLGYPIACPDTACSRTILQREL